MFLFRLINSISLIWKLLTDKRVPFFIRMSLPLALIYTISPIDFLCRVKHGIPIAIQLL